MEEVELSTITMPGHMENEVGSGEPPANISTTATVDITEEPTGKPTKKDGKTDGKASPEVSSEEAMEGWDFLWNSCLAFDQEQMDKWKDELNNLLVFAGLFSAVVTSFTVESYQWLQEDPADKSAELLERISLQLASFTISAGFINSTQSLASLIKPSFEPDPVLITVNSLWFLSLALSLIAAFFTIAVQQWLRNLPLPRHLTTRDSLRLRYSRHEAFVFCQVPHIITLLPVVLQVAVVLFLVGLYHFLRTLDHPTTVAFSVVTGTPFFLYAASLFLPLLWPACPYKSPIIPALRAVFTWTFVLISIVAFIFLTIPGFILVVIFSLSCAPCFYPEPGDSDASVKLSMDRVYTSVEYGFFRILAWAAGLISASFTVLSDFWADREVVALRRHSTSDLHESDADALGMAPKAIPKNGYKLLRPCLLELPAQNRCKCVLNWVIFSLGTYTAFDYGITDNHFRPLNLQIITDLTTDPILVGEFKQPLLDALPKDDEWDAKDWIEEHVDVSVVLILLMQIVKSEFAETSFRDSVVGVLMRTSASQKFAGFDPSDADHSPSLRYPTVSLFGCTVGTGYEFTREQTHELLTLAQKRMIQCLEIQPKLRRQMVVSVQDTVFGLAAITLTAAHQHLPTIDDSREDFWTEITELLTALSGFISTQSADIHLMARLCQDRPEQILLITPKAVNTIAESLLALVEAGQVPPSAVDVCGQLTKSLAEDCSGYPVFEGAMPVLARLQELCPAPQSAATEPMVTGVDDSSVLADAGTTLGDEIGQGVSCEDAANVKKGYLALLTTALSSSDGLLEGDEALPELDKVPTKPVTEH